MQPLKSLNINFPVNKDDPSERASCKDLNKVVGQVSQTYMPEGKINVNVKQIAVKI
jgi:hypothetical protein